MAGEQMDDAALLARAQRGDAAALAQVLQQNYLFVKKYLVRVTLDRMQAEDLTQETMIRAIQRIAQYSGRAKFSTWLIAIATNLYTDALRRRQRERRLLAGTLPDPDPPGAGPGAGEDWREMLERLRGLPRDVALPVVLRHYYGYAYEEIAEWMGIPVGTVKSRTHNGVRALQRGSGG